MNYVVDRGKLMVQLPDDEVMLAYHVSTHSELTGLSIGHQWLLTTQKRNSTTYLMLPDGRTTPFTTM